MNKLILGIVLDKIKSGIIAHAGKNNISKNGLYLKIYPNDEEFEPAFEICDHVETITEITFQQFTGISNFLGFDVSGEGEKWIKRFMVMCASDNNIDAYDNHFYFIRINKNDQLQAYMYLDNKPFKEIDLNYILKTK